MKTTNLFLEVTVRRFPALVLFIGIAAMAGCSSSAVVAPAQSAGGGVGEGQQGMVLTVRNKSDTCAWVTIYNSTSITPWSIEDSTDGHARFVKPGAKFDFYWTLDYAAEEVKVRAEMTREAGCGGGVIRDISAENRDLNGGHGTLYLESNIAGSNPNYSISRP